MRDEYMRLGRVKLASGLEHAKGGIGTTTHQNHSGGLNLVELPNPLLSWRSCVSELEFPGITGEKGEQVS